MLFLQLVLALYPQTTCFYRALIYIQPEKVRCLLLWKTKNWGLNYLIILIPFQSLLLVVSIDMDLW